MNLTKFPKHLRIAVIESILKNKFDELKTADGESVYLFDGYIIKLLSEIFRFSFDLLKINSIGISQPGGNWTGCVGIVQRERADLAICGAAITEERSNAVNFSYPYMYAPVTFVTDKPVLLPNSFAILYAFSWKIWLALMITFIIVSFFIYGFFRRRRPYSTILLHMYGNLVEQSFEIKSGLCTTRLLNISWIIGVMFITYSYKAVLLAFFSFPSFSGIRNIKELSEAVKKPSFQCLTTRGSFIHQALMQSNDEQVKRISNCIRRTKDPGDSDQFLLNSTYEKASIAGKSYFIKYKRSHFISEDIFFTAMVGALVSQKFCCLDVLNKAILRITEAGFIQKYHVDTEFFFTLNAKPSDYDQTTRRVLVLQDLYGAFLILITALLLSTLLLFLEIIFHRLTKNLKK